MAGRGSFGYCLRAARMAAGNHNIRNGGNMAGSINKVILIGNLGADPEVRHTQNGDPIVNLRVATSETWKDKNTGERPERTEWHRGVIFNENLGKVAKNYLRKGSKVYLEGQIQTRKWQNKDGQDVYTTEVVMQRFRGELVMLDRKGEGGGDYAPAASTQAATPAYQGDSGGSGGGGGDIDDEIPF